MADVAGDASIASWVQAGGVVAFASAVLVLIRDFKREMSAMFTELGKVMVDVNLTLSDVKVTMSALLERERARAERIAAEAAARRGSVPESFESELTGPLEVPPPPRRTPPGGSPYVQHNRPKTSGGR